VAVLPVKATYRDERERKRELKVLCRVEWRRGDKPYLVDPVMRRNGRSGYRPEARKALKGAWRIARFDDKLAKLLLERKRKRALCKGLVIVREMETSEERAAWGR
jgi:hypothetical protein